MLDWQLRKLWAAADSIAVEERGVLEGIVARLQLQRGFLMLSSMTAVCAALTGLIQSAA
jgi:hypothetical protein